MLIPQFLYFCALVVMFLFKSVHGSTDLEFDEVTCGSVVKLMNTNHRARLHSHDVKYGSGSQQQSVTAVDNSDDHNSHWQIIGPYNSHCSRGEPVKCGDSIRLLHVATGKYLHSHFFSSPLSHNLEVSCFGEDGKGDTGDNWVVVCNGDNWQRDETVRFRHKDTDAFLHITGDTFGRPIHGQKEVCGYANPHPSNYWRTVEGVYMMPKNSDGNGL